MDRNLLRQLMHCLVIMVVVFFITPNLSYGQCAGTGRILLPADNGNLGNPSILDPDGDGDIVGGDATMGGLSEFSSTVNNLAEFEPFVSGLDCDCEVPWTPVGGIIADPSKTNANGDLNGSGACGNTDIISDGSDPVGGPFDHAYYTIFDGDGNCSTSDLNIAFRIRVGDPAPGNFSFEILASTDGLVGTADPDGILCCTSGSAANIGFEREVQLKTGGSNGVFVYDIDGPNGIDYTNTVLNQKRILSASIADNSQVSYACGTDPACDASSTVFYTFYIPLSALGITNCLAQLPDLQFVAVSTQSGNSAIAKCSSTSDIGGVDGSPSNSNCGTGPYTGACADNAQKAATIDALLCAVGGFNNPLPVELIDFSAKLETGQVNLDWSTASEQNNLGFEVEKSRNGRNWDVLEFVPGRGTTSETINYSYEDKNPLPGYNYYRLKQLNYNGTYEYSEIVSVLFEREKGNILRIMPNPTDGIFRVGLSNPNQQRALVQIFDSTGSLIWSQQFNERETDIYWEKEFDLPRREVYFVVTQVGADTETQKVVFIDKH